MAALSLAAAVFGGGGRGYFSPDTLECRTHREWLIPLTDVPLFRGPSSTRRYPLVDYLVAEGFWSPSGAREPRWFSTFQWNQQWRDGGSRFHRVCGRYGGDQWIAWSKQNPEMAKVLWPRVLDALRRPGADGTGEAEMLLLTAEHARSLEEFEQLAEELECEFSPE